MNLKVMIVRTDRGVLDFHCNAAVCNPDMRISGFELGRNYRQDGNFAQITETMRPVVHALLGDPTSGIDLMFFEPQRFGLDVGKASPALFELVLAKLHAGFNPASMTVLAVQDSLTAANLEALKSIGNRECILRFVPRAVAERLLFG